MGWMGRQGRDHCDSGEVGDMRKPQALGKPPSLAGLVDDSTPDVQDDDCRLRREWGRPVNPPREDTGEGLQRGKGRVWVVGNTEGCENHRGQEG